MFSWLVRRALLTLLVVAMIGLSAPPAPVIAGGMGMSSLATDRAPCDQESQAPQSKDKAHGNDLAMSCGIGLGCILMNFTAPDAVVLPARLVTYWPTRWPRSKASSGLAVAPDIRPPIRSI